MAETPTTTGGRSTETEGVLEAAATVWHSAAGTESQAGRVRLREAHLDVVTEAGQATIPLETVFDVSRRTPAHLGLETDDTVTVAFYADETRQAATVDAGSAVNERLTAELFGLLLDGRRVLVSQEGSDAVAATLSVTPAEMTLERGTSSLSIPTADVRAFARRDADDERAAGEVGLRWRRESTVETAVALESTRAVNLLGRYLQLTTELHATDRSDLTVLFVDDDDAFAETLAAFAEREYGDIETEVAGSAVEGVEVLERTPGVDGVVSDYKMGGTDGIEFLEGVRRVRPNLPFVLLTGEGNEAVAERALAAGVTDYVRKDAISGRFPAVVERIVGSVGGQRPHTAE
jgi:CheY-like chemotaxis protein